MQRIKSYFDVARCYHDSYKPSFMARLVASFKDPIPIYGFVGGVRRAVIGHIEKIEQQGADLFGVVVKIPEHAKMFDGRYVHTSWYMSGAQVIGLSEAHLSHHPHATNYDLWEDDDEHDE